MNQKESVELFDKDTFLWRCPSAGAEPGADQEASVGIMLLLEGNYSSKSLIHACCYFSIMSWTWEMICEKLG